MFGGRKQELKILEEEYKSSKNSLVVIYGRRRVGKSSLIEKFGKNKKLFYSFEAIEQGTTIEQIQHFTESLKKQINDPILSSIHFKTWREVFNYLDQKFVNNQHKVVLCFDEFQWMAAGQSKLPSLLKFVWDTQWKNKKIMLILCGSIASYMVKKVVKSKALYGRISREILLQGLEPNESLILFKNKRSKEEVLKYLLIFGGIPKYLENIDLNESFNKNMNRLCFSKGSFMLEEPDAIFYSQFKETETYLKIVRLLQTGIHSYKQISDKLKICSGGGLTSYLYNLELAEIISEYKPFDNQSNTNLKRYKLSDEFLCFFYKYMEPNLDLIQGNRSSNLFDRLCASEYLPWMGYAFERFCLKHAYYLIDKLGLTNEVLRVGPYFKRNDQGFQIDLAIARNDNVISLCEIKYQESPIKTTIIPEFERKLSLFPIPKGYCVEKVLISTQGPTESLKDTGYFHQYLDLEGIFNDN